MHSVKLVNLSRYVKSHQELNQEWSTFMADICDKYSKYDILTSTLSPPTLFISKDSKETPSCIFQLFSDNENGSHELQLSERSLDQNLNTTVEWI